MMFVGEMNSTWVWDAVEEGNLSCGRLEMKLAVWQLW